MSSMLNVDLARALDAERRRQVADRAAAGPVPPRVPLRDRMTVLLRRMRRKALVVAPVVVAPVALVTPEIALDEVA